jgi:hypothetical protein
MPWRTSRICMIDEDSCAGVIRSHLTTIKPAIAPGADRYLEVTEVWLLIVSELAATPRDLFLFVGKRRE